MPLFTGDFRKRFWGMLIYLKNEEILFFLLKEFHKGDYDCFAQYQTAVSNFHE